MIKFVEHSKMRYEYADLRSFAWYDAGCRLYTAQVQYFLFLIMVKTFLVVVTDGCDATT